MRSCAASSPRPTVRSTSAVPTLAATLARLGLIDEYRIYQRPVVVGGGKAFFAAETPALSLLDVEMLPEDTVLLRYQPVR